MKAENNIETKLSRIEEFMRIQSAEPMTLEQAAAYLGFSKSYMYKLTCLKQIAYFKPNGKKIFFEKSELNKWILKRRIKTDAELEEEAKAIIKKGGDR